MREFLSGHTIANRIRLQRSAHAGSFLLVEGDTDARMFKNFRDEECSVVPAHGRQNLLGAARILLQNGFEGLLAIADADFDRLEGKAPPYPEVLFTDTHDLETLLVRSSALDRVLNERGSDDKLKGGAEQVRRALLDAISPLGFLRWANHRGDHGVSFADVRFGSFIDKRTLEVSTDDLHQHLLNLNGHHKRALMERIRHEVQQLMRHPADLWQVCQGHDMVEVLALGLQQRFGTHNAKDVHPDTVAAMLRLAFRWEDFRQTDLYHSIRQWESLDPGFRFLAPQ